MSDIAIKVENLSKRYRIGLKEELHDTFMGAITSWLRSPLHNFKQLRQLSHFSDNGRDPSTGLRTGDDVIWALKDVSFEVKQGEVVGIIGRNGAGKSTLLKILSRITEPTAGRAVINGRVSSLLEVGTGFHPELTGRENVYLNGTVLGMSKQEIDRKFDKIVAFAEVEKFIDTPVKRYSSGMQVRLAFAVAAHLEPEILLVDEVLAVGDVAFQKKCMGKMGDVAKEGRTVLFVSHNMATVETLCPRALLLRGGYLAMDDSAATTIFEYLKVANTHFEDGLAYGVNRQLLENSNDSNVRITEIALLSNSEQPLTSIQTGDPIILRVCYEAGRTFLRPAFVVNLRDEVRQEILRISTEPISGYPIDKLGTRGYIDLLIEALPLTAGRYYFDIKLAQPRIGWVLKLEEVVVLDVNPRDVYGGGVALDRSHGIIVVPHKWVHQPNP